MSKLRMEHCRGGFCGISDFYPLIPSFRYGIKESGGRRRDSGKNLTIATGDTFLRIR